MMRYATLARQRSSVEDEPSGVAARSARTKRVGASRRRGDDDDDDHKKSKPTSRWKYFAIRALMCGGGLQVHISYHHL
jgi:hypothetical protein